MGNISELLILIHLIFSSNGVILRFNSTTYADFSIVLDDLVDSGPLLRSFNLKTKRQCVLECVSLVSCKSVNFHKVSGRCELVGRALAESKTHLASKEGWVYMTTNDDGIRIGPTCKLLSPCENNAVCEEIEEEPRYKCICDSTHSGKHCQSVKAYTSCKEVYNAGFRKDGVFRLKNMGYHHCVLTPIPGCNSGGWTLLVRTDGNSNRFRYNSGYWSSVNVFNHIFSLKQGLDGEEAKFDAFNKMPFDNVCIGLKKNGGIIKYLQLYRPEPSMKYLMYYNNFKGTTAAKSTWLGLIPGSNLQSHCNRQGFNSNAGAVRVRIGMVTNNENDCNTPDSIFGIGTGGIGINTGAYNSDTSSEYRTKGFILVQ